MTTDVVEKIRKLLALSQSPNVHEAALAAQRAREMMDEHGIECADLADPDPVASRTLESTWTKKAWYCKLVTGVAKSCFCQTAVISDKRGQPASLTMWGRPTDMAAALLLVEWLRREIMRLADRDGRFQPREWKESFYVGAVDEVLRRLEHRATESALVRYGADADRDIAEHLSANGIHLMPKTLSVHIRHDAEAAGNRAAADAVLTAPERRFK